MCSVYFACILRSSPVLCSAHLLNLRANAGGFSVIVTSLLGDSLEYLALVILAYTSAVLPLVVY